MPRILIVDDEPSIRALLTAAFELAGYTVRTAPDGPSAIALFRSESFDLMLSDVVMPSMTGHDLAQWVAEASPDTRTILMSGYDLTCQNCPYSPRCKLLKKPFRPDEAITMVGELLAS